MKQRTIEIIALISVVIVSFFIFAPAFKEIRQERTPFVKYQEEIAVPADLPKSEALAILDNDGKYVYVYDHKIGNNRYRLFFFGKSFQVIKEQ